MIGMSKLTHRIEKKAVEILVDRIMAERFWDVHLLYPEKHRHRHV